MKRGVPGSRGPGGASQGISVRGMLQQAMLALFALSCATFFLRTGLTRRERVAHLERETRGVDHLSANLSLVTRRLARLRERLEHERRVELSLEKIPFDQGELEVWHRPHVPQQFLALKPLHPLPEGSLAWKIARSLNWPDEWEARHRPLAFFLGPPRTGAGSLADCARRAMWGNETHRPYPMAQELYPFNFTELGEPIIGESPALNNFILWNRTGYRYFDPPLEWWTYPEAGRYNGRGRGWLQRRRYPPVEERSRNWILTDATPDQLMIPDAADAAAADFHSRKDWPIFVVLWRDGVDRAFSHFLLFTVMRVDWGWGPEKEKHFPNQLHFELQRLQRKEICRKMMERPEELMRSIVDIGSALRECMYDPRQADQAHYFSFGFTALGLAYWMHHFDPRQFRVLRHSDRSEFTADESMSFLETTFGFKRRPKRCKRPRDWLKESCTPHHRWNVTQRYCGVRSMEAVNQNLEERVVKQGGFTKGKESELKEFRLVSARWNVIMQNLLAEKKVPVYNRRTQEYEYLRKLGEQ